LAPKGRDPSGISARTQFGGHFLGKRGILRVNCLILARRARISWKSGAKDNILYITYPFLQTPSPPHPPFLPLFSRPSPLFLYYIGDLTYWQAKDKILFTKSFACSWNGECRTNYMLTFLFIVVKLMFNNPHFHPSDNMMIIL